MERVTGIGGVFFRARDPQALSRWCADHLGVPPPLRHAGIEVDEHEASYPNGRFAELSDPEGTPIQLWEPASPGRR